MHVSTDVCGGQKRTLDPMELDSQTIVSHLMWVLETELGPLQEHSALTTSETLKSLNKFHLKISFSSFSEL